MERLSYLDFELKIEREGDHYTAQVLRSPAGEASSAFTLPFSEEKLELLVLKIGHVRSGTRRIHTAEMEAARELGGKLFEAVFDGELRACLRSCLEEANRQEGVGLRLKLRLQDAELADLPWEFLLDPAFDRFLAQSNQTPIVRYIEMPERIKPFTLQLPLQMLVMISSPADYARLDVEREKSFLQKALYTLNKQEKVAVKWLEKPTLAALQRCLRDDEYHIFHFIGHGGFDQKAEEGVLVLEDEQGRGWQAGAHRLGTILHDHRSLRLAVLNACEGARNSRTDPFAGVATTLIRQGVPAVVAMQFEITDDAAITFADEFYTALAEGFPVDAAVAEARKAIYAQPNDIEWGTPVLYMRSADGILFNVMQKAATEVSQVNSQTSITEQKAPKAEKQAKLLQHAQAQVELVQDHTDVKQSPAEVESRLKQKERERQELLERKQAEEAAPVAPKSESKKISQVKKAASKLEPQVIKAEKESPQQQTASKPITSKFLVLRKTPTTISREQFGDMLKKHRFYCAESLTLWNYAWSNSHGKGITHDYVEQTLNGDKVVLDKTTGLMWQQSGSPNSMTYPDAEKYIRELNKANKPFAGFTDWRLPTLEEAMSLMEPQKKNGDLHIDPQFDQTQRWVWTSDRHSDGVAWVVDFDLGNCGRTVVRYDDFVRAVR